MKKIFLATALVVSLMSCNDRGENSSARDTSGDTNASPIDSTQNADSVMATDTMKRNLDNTGNVEGGDSSNQQ